MNREKLEFEAYDVPNGFTVDSTETEFCNCSWIQIQDKNGEEAMGRAI